MLQADFPRFREILAGMAEVYQRELSGPLADAYWLALQDWTLPDFEAAARNLLTTSQFFPRPADFAAIRNAANKRTAGEAWLEALDACPNWRYGTASVDPLTDRVVAMLGGYKHLAMEPLDQQHWTAKRFTEMYENLEAVEQVRDVMPRIEGPQDQPRLQAGTFRTFGWSGEDSAA